MDILGGMRREKFCALDTCSVTYPPSYPQCIWSFPGSWDGQGAGAGGILWGPQTVAALTWSALLHFPPTRIKKSLWMWEWPETQLSRSIVFKVNSATRSTRWGAQPTIEAPADQGGGSPQLFPKEDQASGSLFPTALLQPNQRFSNVSRISFTWGLVETQMPGPPPELQVGLRSWVSNEFPGEASAAGLGTELWQPRH